MAPSKKTSKASKASRPRSQRTSREAPTRKATKSPAQNSAAESNTPAGQPSQRRFSSRLLHTQPSSSHTTPIECSSRECTSPDLHQHPPSLQYYEPAPWNKRTTGPNILVDFRDVDYSGFGNSVDDDDDDVDSESISPRTVVSRSDLTIPAQGRGEDLVPRSRGRSAAASVGRSEDIGRRLENTDRQFVDDVPDYPFLVGECSPTPPLRALERDDPSPSIDLNRFLDQGMDISELRMGVEADSGLPPLRAQRSMYGSEDGE